MNPIPLPYMILGGIAAAAFVGFSGYRYGVTETEEAWQVKNLKAAAEVREAKLERLNKLLEAANKQREDDAAADAKLQAANRATDRRLLALVDGLRDRPDRPGNAASGVPEAASGAGPGTTGAGLYREDAAFLGGEAARANRLRAALERCYATLDSADANQVK